MNSIDFDEEASGPLVECLKYGTCRMNCVSKCQTGKLKYPERDKEWDERWKAKYGNAEVSGPPAGANNETSGRRDR